MRGLCSGGLGVVAAVVVGLLPGVVPGAGGVAWAAKPTLPPLPAVTMRVGSPMHVVLPGTDPEGGVLTYTATSNVSFVTPVVQPRYRSLKLRVQTHGTMTFYLFEQYAPRATNRIITLANEGFYNNIIFHRVMNNFVIQAGDPGGTGTGGSSYPDFDDQFHTDLQHNRTGVLSMAKSNDDTNDSQFFITEGAQRHLDFNHTIFGLLTSGESVREAISNVATNSSSKPLTNVKIQEASIFTDTQNGVLMLKANSTGQAIVTVVCTDSQGLKAQRSFRVTVQNDNADGAPFLGDIRYLRTKPNTPITYRPVGIDAEGSGLYFDIVKLNNGQYNFSESHATGQFTLTPLNSFNGTLEVGVAVRQNATPTTSDIWDTQIVKIEVANDPSADAFEPDNIGADATVIPITGAAQTHSIHRSDIDWVKFTLAQKSRVTIRAAGADGKWVRLQLRGPNQISKVPVKPNQAVAYVGASETVINRSAAKALSPGSYWVRVDGMGMPLDSYTISVTAVAVP